MNENIYSLADEFVKSGIIPENKVEDALHISTATFHGMDYLLTWNCRHIANAIIRNSIEKMCHDSGYMNPIICTPEELMGD